MRKGKTLRIDDIVGLGLVGSVCGFVGSLVAFSAPTWPTVIGLLWLVFTALSALGTWWVRAGQMQRGAWVLMASGALLLPIGAVSLFAGWRAYQYQKFGVHLGRYGEEAEARPRPQAWTRAAVVYGLIAIGALVAGLVALRARRVVEIEALIEVLSASLLAALAAVEAGLLWSNHEQAPRLGIGLGVAMIIGLVLAGFYLHSYLAVAVLGAPFYAIVLILQGRRRWKGLSSTS